MCFCYQFLDERDSRTHPAAAWEGGLTSHRSLSSFPGPPSFLGCASHLHTFVSSRGGLQLIKAFSYNLPESRCFQPLPAAERERCQARKKERKGKKKERVRKQKGGGEGNTYFGPKQKRRAGMKESSVCVCLCLVFYTPLEAGTILC